MEDISRSGQHIQAICEKDDLRRTKAMTEVKIHRSYKIEHKYNTNGKKRGIEM